MHKCAAQDIEEGEEEDEGGWGVRRKRIWREGECGGEEERAGESKKTLEWKEGKTHGREEEHGEEDGEE
jgi:hypothetical protein